MYEFEYYRPQQLEEAVKLLGDEDAKVLAGGHSLIPVLKQRLARPSALVDIGSIGGLSGIRIETDTVIIGAMTRHTEVASSKELRKALPGLAAVASSIGDPHVRHRGTIGGSIANNDPNADYPAACLGLNAMVVTTKRRIPADEFFTGMFSTALDSDEIITEVVFPIAARSAYQKFEHPASGFALVGVFVSQGDSGVRVAVTGAGAAGVFRAHEYENELDESFEPRSLDGITMAVDGLNGDIHASAAYRAHLVGVMTQRAVAAVM
jgi:carbon-monoxide dehydrogenase medium subunit